MIEEQDSQVTPLEIRAQVCPANWKQGPEVINKTDL